MLNFLLSQILRRTSPPAAEQALCLQWVRDPLSHPALEGMSERELGDLPFRR